MATKFTKGGILSSNQLEDISNKKWKKGGILSATQLNELAGGNGQLLNDFLAYKLKKIVLDEWPPAPVAGATRLPQYLFQFHSEIEEIVLPPDLPGEPVAYFGNNIFANCSNLKSIKLPSNIKSIPYMAFYHCDALKDLDIPDSVEDFGSSAFSYSGLKSIRIPKSLKTCGSSFEYTDIEEIDFSPIEDRQVSFSIYSLSQMPKLKRVIYPKNVKFPSDKMAFFVDCPALEYVNIPKSVKTIGASYSASQFGAVTFTEPIYLSNNIKTIYSKAFEGCDGVLNCEWSEGAVANAPWGFLGTINYDVPYVDAY